MYARYNFFPAILGKGKPVLVNSNAPQGHHKNDMNPWSDSDLYIMFKDANGNWSAPHNLPTNDSRADCCAMIAGDELFFQKETDIYVARYIDNSWTNAEKLPINSKDIDTNPHYDWQTKTLYWASNRGGNMDIWQSTRQGKKWSKPITVIGDVNTDAKEDQPYIFDNKLYFSRDGQGILVAQLHNGKWNVTHAETYGTQLYHAEPTFTNNGEKVWFTAGDLNKEQLLFMESNYNETDKTWDTATPININFK